MITLERKRELCQAMNVTLDGEPAGIGGCYEPFANVFTFSGTKKHEFAWETVDRIVSNNNGEFKS